MSCTAQEKSSEIVAYRWAKALLELANEENTSKQVILDNLKEVVETFNSSQELTDAVNNPSVSTEEKQIIICKLFKEKIIPVVYNFIFALNLKKRLNIVEQIAVQFEREVDKENGLLHVNVTSAIELDENRKANIKSKISDKLNKEIVLDFDVDESIIAGLKFNIDETIIDNSVRHKLDNLSKNIIKR